MTADLLIERAIQSFSAQMDERIVADARRLLDDLLIGADGHWRTAEEVNEQAEAFLDACEESKAEALAEVRVLLEARLKEGPTE